MGDYGQRTTEAHVNGLWGRPGLWAIVGSHVLSDFYVGAVSATLPYFVIGAGYSYADIAGLSLAVTSVASVSQPAFGVLADRYRLRWAIPSCIAVCGVAMSLSASAPDHYLVVWLLIALAGVASAGYHPPATIVVRDLAPGTSTPLSVFAAAGNLGVALGPVAVVAVVGGHGLSATPLLMVPGILALGVYAVVAARDPVLRQRPVVPRGSGRPGGPVGPVATGGPLPVLPPDRWGLFGRLLVTLTVWQLVFTATAAFIAVLLVDEFGTSDRLAALPLTLFPAAGAAGTMLGGLLGDRVGRLVVIRGGYAVALVAAVAVTASPTAWLTIAAACVMGLGVFGPMAPQLTLAHAYLPRRVGAASGMALGLTAAAGGLLTAGLGHVADETGLRPVFAVLAVSLAVGIGTAFTLRDPAGPDVPASVRDPDRAGPGLCAPLVAEVEG